MGEISRRGILEAGLALGLAGALPMGRAAIAAETPDSLALNLDLRGLRQLGRAAADALGRPDAAALKASLFPKGDLDADIPALRTKVQEDFRAGRIIALADWGLAETEVEIVYLLADSLGLVG